MEREREREREREFSKIYVRGNRAVKKKKTVKLIISHLL